MKKVGYVSLIKTFLKLGSVGFGGPLVLISLMEKEFCVERGWVNSSEFKEAFVFCKLLPGPIAYQMALWVGRRLAGTWGGILAGISFLLPGLSLIVLLAALYTYFTQVQAFQLLMEGMRVGALVIIAESVYRMWQPHQSDSLAWVFLLLGALLMALLPSWEPLIIIVCGVVSVFLEKAQRHFRLSMLALPLGVFASPLFSLFWVHFKAGAFVFGTGLAIIPFLEHEVVQRYGWLSHQVFLDGIALGQVTPGPITISSAFIGYRVAGISGALAGALGMYLPGIFLVLGVLPLILSHSKKWSWLVSFQKGAVPAVMGCLVTASFILAKASVVSWAAAGTLFIAILVWHFSKLPGWAVLLLAGPIRWLIEAAMRGK